MAKLLEKTHRLSCDQRSFPLITLGTPLNLVGLSALEGMVDKKKETVANGHHNAEVGIRIHSR